MKHFRKNEDGVMEIEGMFIFFTLIIFMVFIMSLGFLLYQRWMVSMVANDTAVRIAQSYQYPTTDPVMGFIKGSVKSSVSPFRYFGKGLERRNIAKAEKYAKWDLEISRLSFNVGEPDIQVGIVYDAYSQQHVVVDITAEYKIPFGTVLKVIGMSDTLTFHARGRSFVHDISDMVYSISNMDEVVNKIEKNLPFVSTVTGAIDKVSNLISDIIELTKDSKQANSVD